MYEALITSGNRITVPRVVRESMGMKTGDVIGFVPSGRGFAMRIVGRKMAKSRAIRAPVTLNSR